MAGFAHAELQAFEYAAHFGWFQRAAQFARQPVEIERDRRPVRCRSAWLSARPPTRRIPGEISGSSSSARASARTVLCGSCDFSNRMEASVRSFERDGSFANARGVEIRAFENDRCRGRAEIALSCPPMTPAMAIGPAASAITRFAGVECVVFVVQREHAFRRRVAGRAKIVSPCSFARSNACMGCASSAMM